MKWLSELYSSPAVWLIDGGRYDRVEVSEGSAEHSIQRPGCVSITVSPAKKVISRQF
jgi:hypothetical protein